MTEPAAVVEVQRPHRWEIGPRYWCDKLGRWLRYGKKTPGEYLPPGGACAYCGERIRQGAA